MEQARWPMSEVRKARWRAEEGRCDHSLVSIGRRALSWIRGGCLRLDKLALRNLPFSIVNEAGTLECHFAGIMRPVARQALVILCGGDGTTLDSLTAIHAHRRERRYDRFDRDWRSVSIVYAWIKL